jgi:hypothetical protein
MPVIDYEEVPAPAGFVVPEGMRVFKWPATGQSFSQNDTGKPVDCGHYADKVVQVTASNFNGSTVTIQGSLHLDPAAAVYATVREPAAGAAVTYTAAGLNQILENVSLIRPSVTAATPTGLVVLLLLSTPARR